MYQQSQFSKKIGLTLWNMIFFAAQTDCNFNGHDFRVSNYENQDGRCSWANCDFQIASNQNEHGPRAPL
jgi:hypothetical protein